MKEITALTMDHYLFSGEKIGNIAILTFKKMPLLHITDLCAKEMLLNYLDLIANDDKIKVLLIRNTPEKMGCFEYVKYYRNIISSSEVDRKSLERAHNAINQFILKLVNLNTMTIHVDSGNVILLFLNISLACHYRIPLKEILN